MPRSEGAQEAPGAQGRYYRIRGVDSKVPWAAGERPSPGAIRAWCEKEGAEYRRNRDSSYDAISEYDSWATAEFVAEGVPRAALVAFRIAVTGGEAIKRALGALHRSGMRPPTDLVEAAGAGKERTAVFTSPYVQSYHPWMAFQFLPLDAVDESLPVALLVWWGPKGGGRGRRKGHKGRKKARA